MQAWLVPHTLVVRADCSTAASTDPIEEERRLAYVALSRAKTCLFLSFVLTDGMGNPMVRQPGDRETLSTLRAGA